MGATRTLAFIWAWICARICVFCATPPVDVGFAVCSKRLKAAVGRNTVALTSVKEVGVSAEG